MNSPWHKLRKALAVTLIIAGSIPIAVVAIAQTKWFKKQLETALQEVCEQNGITLSIGDIEGSLPLQWKFSEIYLEKKGDLNLFIRDGKIRVAFFPLFQKKIVISYLNTSEAELLLVPKHQESGFRTDSLLTLSSLPFDVAFPSFRIDKIKIVSGDQAVELALKGSFILKKCAKKLTVDLFVHDLEKGNRLEVHAKGGHLVDHLAIQVSAQLAQPFLPTYPLLVSFDMEGPWETWQQVLNPEYSQSASFKEALLSYSPRVSPKCEVAEATLCEKFREEVRAIENKHAQDSCLIVNHEASPFLGEPLLGKLHATLASLDVQADLSLHSDRHLEGEFALDLPDLSLLKNLTNTEIQGSATAHGSLQKGRLQLEWGTYNTLFGLLHLDSWKNTLIAEHQEEMWKGAWTSMAKTGDASAAFKTGVNLNMGASTYLQLEKMELLAPSFTSGGDLHIDFAPFTISGDILLAAQKFQSIQPFVPSLRLSGAGGGSIHLSEDHQVIDVLAHNLEWRDVFIGSGNLYADLQGPLLEPKGKIDIEAEHVYFTNSHFSYLHLQGESDSNGWPISLEAEGTWKHPFQIAMNTYYHPLQQSLTLEKIDGSLFEKPLHLVEPVAFNWNANSVSLDAFQLKIDQGLLKGFFRKNLSELTLSLHGDKLPVAWLSMYTPYLSLQGESSIDCELAIQPDNIQGMCRLDLGRLQATKQGEPNPINVKGSIEARIAQENIQIHSFLEASEQQWAMLHLSLPYSYQISPLSIHLCDELPLSGSLEIEGKLDELFHFANTGSQTLSGWAAGRLLLFGTAKKPELQGTLTLEQASYENHHSGFGVYDLETVLHAENGTITATSLFARDHHEGTFQGKAEIKMDKESSFPYRLEGKFDHFNAIDLDLIQATLSGPATLEGNLRGALLKGALNVDTAKATIPKSLPPDLPNLPYTFSDKEALNAPPPRPSFPFALDVTVSADDTVSFEGNGLSSTWGGTVHLHGTAPDILASGTLRLSKGQFQILGKTFVLQQGELTFSDKPGQEGYLSISGTVNIQEAAITAQLRGPLSSPQLSFYSMPALTTNEIFSLLLFNKRVSEIKPVQAVQLAHTLLTFYGHTGWNPVTQIGRGLSTIGIDTFDIVPSEEGLKQSSVTIGKHFYLMRNLLVTLTQSRDSRRFMVEVDIGKGLIFQAENQSGAEQSQQEGKFSLKWNKNY